MADAYIPEWLKRARQAQQQYRAFLVGILTPTPQDICRPPTRTAEEALLQRRRRGNHRHQARGAR